MQPFLIPVNGTKADLCANYVKDDNDNDIIEIYWGCCLLQTVPLNSDLFEFRMIVGLLYNLKYSLEQLEKCFKVSAKTIRRWGKAIRNGSPEEINSVFLGHRNLEKLSDEVKKYICTRYLELKDSSTKFRTILIDEVARYFGKDVSGELLRPLFRQADQELLASIDKYEESTVQNVSETSPHDLLSHNTEKFIDNSDIHSEDSTKSSFGTEPDRTEPDSKEPDSKEPDRTEPDRTEPDRTESDRTEPDHTEPDRKGLPCDIPSIKVKTEQHRHVKREYPCVAQSAIEATHENHHTESQPFNNRANDSKKQLDSMPISSCARNDSDSFKCWVNRVPDNPIFIHHAGLFLFMDKIEKELWTFPAIVRQTFWQVMAGAVCQEQGRRVDAEGMLLLVGDFISDINYQRHLLSEVAEIELIKNIYQLNSTLTRTSISRFFYFDPHTEIYTGMMKVIRDWCGALKGVSKAIHMDFIHTEFGEPCFTRHADGCNDMRDRFQLCAAYFKTKILGLTATDPLIYCIDRGIWGQRSLQAIADAGDKIITWEKGYTNSEWLDQFIDEGEFSRKKKKNSSSGKATIYSFKWRVKSWNGLADGQKIIVKVSKNSGTEAELSIVTNCTSLAITVIIWAMFNRWLQENDFKYLRAHFGIGMLVERRFVNYADLESIEKDRQIESRAIKIIKKKKKSIEMKMSSVLLKLKRKFKQIPSAEQLEKEQQRIKNKIMELRNQVCDKNTKTTISSKRSEKAYKKKLSRANAISEKAEKKDELEKQIIELELLLDEIEKEITLTPKKESRLKALVEQQYVRPAFRSRALADAIKILARNTFGHFHRDFRIDYDNYREDHVMYRIISRAPGFIIKKDGEVIITLMPSLSIQKGEYAKIQSFVQDKSYNSHSKVSQVRFRMPDKEQKSAELLKDFFK